MANSPIKYNWSPMSGISNLSMRIQQRFGVTTTVNNTTLNSHSRVSELPFLFKIYNSNQEIWEIDEDFLELRRAEREYKRRIVPLLKLDELDQDNRENLIWKIKKIWDTFELSDNTFYTSVLLNDFQGMSATLSQCPYKEK